MAKQLLTCKQVAQQLGVTRQQVSLLIARGILPARRRKGTHWRWRYSLKATDVQAYQVWRQTGHVGPVLCPDDVTAVDAAAQLGIQLTALYRRLWLGRIPAHRHGRTRWAIRRQDLEDALPKYAKKRRSA